VYIQNIPVDIAIILSLGRKLPIQLNTHETSGFSPHTAHKAHRPVHFSRNIDQVADFQARAHGAGRNRHGAGEGVQRGLAVQFGGGAGAERRRGSLADPADGCALEGVGGADGAESLLLGRCFVVVERHLRLWAWAGWLAGWLQGHRVTVAHNGALPTANGAGFRGEVRLLHVTRVDALVM
jgi:hypothetical protein